MILFWWLLMSLAALRIASMLASEDGPFDLFSTWRDFIGQGTWIGRGFHCVLCLSFWLAALLALPLPWATITDYLYLWFGGAGLALFLHKMTEQS